MPNRWSDDWQSLADASAIFVERRIKGRDKAVENEKVSAGQADWEIACWKAIAQDWKFCAALSGEPGTERDITIRAKTRAIEISLGRIREALAKRPAAEAYQQEVQILEAMLARYENGADHINCARITIALRDAAETDERKDAA